MRKILVTGATGFVGKTLVEQLLQDEENQLTIVSTGSENKLPDVLFNYPTCIAARKHKVLYQGLEGIDWRHVSGQDVVFHLAANNDTQCQDQDEMLRANLYGPIKLFVTAEHSGCKNFVYASSTAVYGNAPVPYDEESTELDPLTYYADSKQRFDEFAMGFAEENGVSVKGVRFCNVYGPGESHKGKRMSMVGQLILKMMVGKTPSLFKSGEQRRDWVYVKDAVQGLMKADQYEGSGVYNIGSGVSTSFNEVVMLINDVLKKNIMPNYIDCPFEDSYQSHTLCEIKKARTELGYEPSFDLASGIAEYVSWITSGGTLPSIPCTHG